MLRPLQRRKLSRMFHLFDRDGDGVLVWEDYARISAGLLSVLGIDPAGELGRELADSYRVEWLELEQEAARDGRAVTLEGWLDYRRTQLMMPDAFEVNVAQYIHIIATHLDRDGDGRVTGADLRHYLGLYGMRDEERDIAVARLDPTGRGRFTYADIEDRAREYYFSNNPEAPGSWFLGPFGAEEGGR